MKRKICYICGWPFEGQPLACKDCRTVKKLLPKLLGTYAGRNWLRNQVIEAQRTAQQQREAQQQKEAQQ